MDSRAMLGLAGCLAFGCGESTQQGPGGENQGGESAAGRGGGSGAGSSGRGGSSTAGSAGRGGSSAAGSSGRGGSGTAGGSGRGGSEGGAGRGSGGDAQAGTTADSGRTGGGESGEPAGGNAGRGAGGGTGGNASGAGGAGASAGESWDAACNGVAPNGHCIGDVYEWCDYFTRSLQRLDCAALGMRCEAEEFQPPETELNGCVGDPCDGEDERCDGRIAYQCSESRVHAVDCAQHGGQDAACVLTEEGYVRCETREPCSSPSSYDCAGNLQLICTEDGYLYFQDCARCTRGGTCVQSGDQTTCEPLFGICENL